MIQSNKNEYRLNTDLPLEFNLKCKEKRYES